MSKSNPIRIFVAHLFKDDADYQRVFEYLESQDNFFYVNSARPDNVPGGEGIEALKEEFRQQIEPAEILILPVAIYEQNPDLVGFQMDVAQASKKPVLGIQSFGGTVAVQQALFQRADDIVEWNDRIIADTIRRLARNEDTNRWEVIDFKLD